MPTWLFLPRLRGGASLSSAAQCVKAIASSLATISIPDHPRATPAIGLSPRSVATNMNAAECLIGPVGGKRYRIRTAVKRCIQGACMLFLTIHTAIDRIRIEFIGRWLLSLDGHLLSLAIVQE